MSIKKKVSAAIYNYKMLETGDRIAIAFSGGKDSVALTLFLKERKEISEFLLIHIDHGFGEDRNKIKKMMEDTGLPHVIDVVDISKEVKNDHRTPCYLCSFFRRKRIFEIAHENGFKKIAFGHTRDDAVVTFIMNIFYHGEVSTLKPVQDFFDGEIIMLRPMYYVREAEIENFLRREGIEYTENPCPYKNQTRRFKIKEMIEDFPDGMNNVYKSMFNIKKEYLP